MREDELLTAYRSATHRLLVLDHLGTLVPSPLEKEEPGGEGHASPSSSSASLYSPIGNVASNVVAFSSSASVDEAASELPMERPSSLTLIKGRSCSSDELPPFGAFEDDLAGRSDGLLPPRVRERPRAPLPSASVRNSLEVLCADHRNTVVVMSTGSREELSAAYGSVPGCSLCADNGLHVAWSGLHGRWEMAGGIAWELSAAAQRAPKDENWKDVALSVIEPYAERTNGAYIESTANDLAFVYGTADPEFGAMMAKELHSHLSDTLQACPISPDPPCLRLTCGFCSPSLTLAACPSLPPPLARSDRSRSSSSPADSPSRRVTSTRGGCSSRRSA